MKKITILLAAFALLSVPNNLGAQVTGATFITGFEMGSLSEGFGTLNGGAIQNGTVRSGNYAYEARALYSNPSIVFASRSSGGVVRQIFKSTRFYVNIAELPLQGSVSLVKIGGASTFNPEVDLNSDGTLTLADSWYPHIATSSLALIAGSGWHRIEFDIGSGLRVYVDGALWAGGSSTFYPAGVSISFGAGESPTSINATCDLFFDDLLVSGGSFGNNLPGDGHVVLLTPMGDMSSNSWTGGAGATTGLWGGINHAPAWGLSVKKATNTSQIKNGSHASNQVYMPNIQTYASAGVSGTVNAVMALTNDGEEGTNGSAKTGSVWISQNPSQPSGYSFDFGDAAGVIGAFPSGWATHAGPTISSPAVNLSASPVVAIQKSSGVNVDVDLLGVYVDYR
jgi:hypothetical protein